jgi:hypothetical protein
MGLGDVKRANALLNQSLVICREMNLTEQLAHGLTDLSNMHAFTGNYGPADATVEEAISLWRGLNNLPMLAFALNVRAQLMLMSGQPARASAAAQEGLAICSSIDNVEGAEFSLGILIESYHLMGDIGTTITYTQQAVDYANSTPVGTLAHFRAVYLNATLGACENVAARVGELLESPILADLPVAMAGQALISLAHAELMCGGPGPAATIMTQMGEKMDNDGSSFNQLLWAGPVITDYVMFQGEVAQALDLAQKTEAAMLEAGMNAYLPEVYLQQARALRIMDRRADAAQALRAGREAAERYGIRFWLWRILALMADLEADPAAAGDLRQRARDTLDGIAATMADHPDLRASFLALPEAAALLEASRTT